MPRPLVRTPAATPAGPRVRDFTGPRSPGVRVEFDVRTAYDFVFSLSAETGETDDLPAEDRRWLGDAKNALRADVGKALDDYADLCIQLAGLAVDRPEVRSAAQFVEVVRSVPDDAMLRVVHGKDLQDPETHGLAERALAGDEAAIDDLVGRSLEGHGPADRDRLAALFRAPAPVLASARAVLGSWLTWFGPIEGRIASMLERDVALRADDRRSLAPVELIERTTGGIRWVSEPGTRRVILAPSYFTRPYNYILGGDDWRLYGYPIADAALGTADPLAPPRDVVRLHRALGDETRLRILRLLRERDLYLTELAGLLDLSKPTVSHHLALLRAAGLVTVTDEGGMTYYTLRRDRLDAASAELKRFLLG